MPLSTSSGKLSRTTYKTPFGPGTLIWRDDLLIALELPGVQRLFAAATQTTSVPGKLASQLESYFSGKRKSFAIDDLSLDRSSWSRFQSAVAVALTAVPYGQTITYAALAAAAGHPRAHRAVGNFMAANPFPVIIPCHRVVRSDGSLGKYSAGEAWKARLLELETQR